MIFEKQEPEEHNQGNDQTGVSQDHPDYGVSVTGSRFYGAVFRFSQTHMPANNGDRDEEDAGDTEGYDVENAHNH